MSRAFSSAHSSSAAPPPISTGYFSRLTEIDRAEPVDAEIRRYLFTGRKYYAGDPEIRTAAATVPFYLNGRPGQRALVLCWLDESYSSKEPVKYDSLTIEHVLPQTPTAGWRRRLANL